MKLEIWRGLEPVACPMLTLDLIKIHIYIYIYIFTC